MIRSLDIVISAVGVVLLAPVLIVLVVLGYFDTRSPIFRQTRVGRHQKAFVLLKFRTMKADTASVATHLVDASAITPFGRFLRWSKLDEVPQIWNVLRGEMSMVGPRPCLFTQEELIRERVQRGVFDVRPGITGLAQVRGIDMSSPRLLAETDREMIVTFTVAQYLKCIAWTLVGKGKGDRVRSLSANDKPFVGK